jgi:hypothetical protein
MAVIKDRQVNAMFSCLKSNDNPKTELLLSEWTVSKENFADRVASALFILTNIISSNFTLNRLLTTAVAVPRFHLPRSHGDGSSLALNFVWLPGLPDQLRNAYACAFLKLLVPLSICDFQVGNRLTITIVGSAVLDPAEDGSLT